MPGETLEKPIAKRDKFGRGGKQRQLLYPQEPSSRSHQQLSCHGLPPPWQPFWNCIQAPVLAPLVLKRPAAGKSLPETSHKVMSKGGVCCLAVCILILSLQPEGLVTPIHLPGFSGFGCLEVLEVTEMSSPNKTAGPMRRDGSSQVPDGRGSGSALLLKQPLCRRALKLQVWGGFIFFFFI